MHIKIIPRSSKTMTQREQDILSSFKDDIISSVDPVTLVSFLFRHGHMSTGLKEYVQLSFRNGRSRENIMHYVYDNIHDEINMSILIHALDKIGYSEIATRLFLSARDSSENNSTRLQQISRCDMNSRKNLQKLYRNLKKLVHESQFSNPRHALRMMEKRFRSKMESEQNEHNRQGFADKCLAILGVELDAYYDSLACDTEITQEEMIVEMRELIPNTTNPLLTDTIVYSRQANLHAFHGDFKHAEEMIVAARSSGSGIGRCLELVNLLYIEVYVKLWEFETTPSRDILEELLMWGRFGLESLMYEDEDTRRLWRRMFLLRMIYGLLGLGNRGNIIVGCTVDRSDIREAQNLLTEVDKLWSGIEMRREMFYCIAKARVAALQGFEEDAIGYLLKAGKLATEGGFMEKIPFIDEFINALESQNEDARKHGTTTNVNSPARNRLNTPTKEHEEVQQPFCTGPHQSTQKIGAFHQIPRNNSYNQAEITEFSNRTDEILDATSVNKAYISHTDINLLDTHPDPSLTSPKVIAEVRSIDTAILQETSYSDKASCFCIDSLVSESITQQRKGDNGERAEETKPKTFYSSDTFPPLSSLRKESMFDSISSSKNPVNSELSQISVRGTQSNKDDDEDNCDDDTEETKPKTVYSYNSLPSLAISKEDPVSNSISAYGTSKDAAITEPMDDCNVGEERNTMHAHSELALTKDSIFDSIPTLNNAAKPEQVNERNLGEEHNNIHAHSEVALRKYSIFDDISSSNYAAKPERNERNVDVEDNTLHVYSEPATRKYSTFDTISTTGTSEDAAKHEQTGECKVGQAVNTIHAHSELEQKEYSVFDSISTTGTSEDAAKYDQTGECTAGEENNTISAHSELLKACNESLGFGSIALFEERSLGEGDSHPQMFGIDDIRNTGGSIQIELLDLKELKHVLEEDEALADSELFG